MSDFIVVPAASAVALTGGGLIGTAQTAGGSIANLMEAGAAVARIHPIATVAVAAIVIGGVAYMGWPKARKPILNVLNRGANWVAKKTMEIVPPEAQPA